MARDSEPKDPEVVQALVTEESLDAAEVFLRHQNISDEYLQALLADKALTRRVRRKVDWILIPLIAGTYMMHFVDKMALSYAAVFDLFSSTGIRPTQYAWFGSIFYFAYILAEYPLVWLAQKTRMGKVVSGCVVAWGVVMLLTAACDAFAGLAACRFLLGMFEAPTMTCFMLTVAMWWVSRLPHSLRNNAKSLQVHKRGTAISKWNHVELQWHRNDGSRPPQLSHWQNKLAARLESSLFDNGRNDCCLGPGTIHLAP